MNNMNLDNEMLNNLKNMMGEKQVNDALSQISPEMIENFSKMMNSNNSQNNESNNIDMETMIKLKSMIDKINSNQNDPRSNLLNSLKPYMRESRKENIDKYANILKLANFAELFNNEKKENNSYD